MVELWQIILGGRYGVGNITKAIEDVARGVADDGWFVECNNVPLHTIYHETGHNIEEYISMKLGGSDGRIVGNNRLWQEISEEFDVTTVDDLFAKYPISGYGIDDRLDSILRRNRV